MLFGAGTSSRGAVSVVLPAAAAAGSFEVLAHRIVWSAASLFSSSSWRAGSVTCRRLGVRAWFQLLAASALILDQLGRLHSGP